MGSGGCTCPLRANCRIVDTAGARLRQHRYRPAADRRAQVPALRLTAFATRVNHFAICCMSRGVAKFWVRNSESLRIYANNLCKVGRNERFEKNRGFEACFSTGVFFRPDSTVETLGQSGVQRSLDSDRTWVVRRDSLRRGGPSALVGTTMTRRFFLRQNDNGGWGVWTVLQNAAIPRCNRPDSEAHGRVVREKGRAQGLAPTQELAETKGIHRELRLSKGACAFICGVPAGGVLGCDRVGAQELR